VWSWLTGHTQQLAAIIVLLIAARVTWAGLRRRAWSHHAARAVWLEITPPVTATPAATVHLWQLLATLLSARGRTRLVAARLVWEVQATPTGMRCGLWVPPGINPTAVLRVLHRAWPGAQVHQTPPPDIAAGAVGAGLGLGVTRPDWLPLIDEDPTRATTRTGGVVDVETDLLRAVYDGLAAAGRTGGGLLQVIVGRAPGWRVAALRQATVNPAKARQRRRGTARVAGLVVVGLRAVLIGVLDALTPGGSYRSSPGRMVDPYDAELARHARIKYATAPHLLVAVRAVGLGPTKAAARAAAADITSGYGLLSGHFNRHRLHRPVPTVTGRWAGEQRMILATVAEVAALAGLPAEPSAYGLPAAGSRKRGTSRDTFDAGPQPARPTRPALNPPAAARPGRNRPGSGTGTRGLAVPAESDDTTWSTS
jgi:hypothetical protein